jgi:hypothetical protein
VVRRGAACCRWHANRAKKAPHTCEAAHYLQKVQVKAAQKAETASQAVKSTCDFGGIRYFGGCLSDYMCFLHFSHPISMDGPEIHVVFAGG